MKRIVLPLLLASALLSQVATAQVSSVTAAIGYYKFDVPNGKSMWNCAFVTKKEFQGLATSVAPSGANTVITQTGAGWTANQFQTSAIPANDSSHYVEILTGPDAGAVADIVSNDASTVTVAGGYGSTAFTYAIRKHTTLADIFLDAGLSEFEDEVLLFDDVGVARAYNYDGTPGARHMVDAPTQSVVSDNVTVYPGQGFVLTIGTPKTLTFGGGIASYVKNTPTRIPLYAGVTNLVGLLDPVVASAPLTAAAANELHAIGTIGLQTAGLAEYEDEIARFGISAGSYTRLTISYYDATLNAIVDAGGTDVGTLPIQNGTAFLVKPLTGATRKYLQPAFHP
jgi:hypothetical protein